MRKLYQFRNLFVLLNILLFLQIEHGRSQELAKSCPDKFSSMNQECIASGLNQKLNPLEIVFKKEVASLVNNVYFFQTNKGDIGSFKISSLSYDKQSCSALLEATVFVKGVQYYRQLNLVTKNDYGNWIAIDDNINLKSDVQFRLSAHEESKENALDVECKLSLLNASGVKYKKMDEAIESNRDLLYWAGLVLVGLSVFIVAIAIFRDEERFKAQEKLEDAQGSLAASNKIKKDFVLRVSRPFFKRYFSPIVSGMKNKRRIRDAYKRELAAAGLTKDLSPEDFFAFKLFLIIGFPLTFLLARLILQETWPLILTPIMGLIGFYYPNFWLKSRIEKRRSEVLYSMPFVVDMLALCTEAGLDFVAAMQRVIEKAKPSALTEELETLIRETKIGSSRAEALRQLSWRINSIEISSFAATLIAADSVGASIAPILKTLSQEIRQKRSADAEKKGATAATKILFPTMFLIMPAVGIMIFAPLLLQFLRG